MKIHEFSKQYPDELSCKIAFKAALESSGIKCMKCGNTSHYWKKNKEQWECKKVNDYPSFGLLIICIKAHLELQLQFCQKNSLQSIFG